MLKKIEDIVVGDKVLTHTGEYGTVTHVFKREYTEKMVALDITGLGTMRVTPNHPILAIRGAGTSCCVTRSGNFCKPGCYYKKSYPRSCAQQFRPEWVPAGELVAGDIVLHAIDQRVENVDFLDIMDFVGDDLKTSKGSPSFGGQDFFPSELVVTDEVVRYKNGRSNPVNRKIKVDGNLLRLIGYYVAEGSVGAHNVMWTFNANEAEYHQDVISLCKAVFGVSPNVRNNAEGKSSTVYVSSKITREFFRSQFGDRAPNKRLPEWIMRLPTDLQYHVLVGMWRGDGCFTKDAFVYTTSSEVLAHQVRMLLYRQGVVPTVRPTRKAGAISTIRGREVKSNYALINISVAGPQVEKLADLLSWPVVRKTRQSHVMTWVDGIYANHPIRGVSLEEYTGTVYNLEVDNQHSYTTQYGTAHNCDALALAVWAARENWEEANSVTFEDNYAYGRGGSRKGYNKRRF